MQIWTILAFNHLKWKPESHWLVSEFALPNAQVAYS